MNQCTCILVVLLVAAALFQNSDAALRKQLHRSDNDGEAATHIFYPSSDTSNDDSNFVPVIPEKCANSTYCTVKSSKYPQAYVDNYIKNHVFPWLNEVDLELNGRQLQVDPTERALCQAVPKVESIYEVMNEDGEWYYAIQSGKYTQRLNVEICSYPEHGKLHSCNTIAKFDSEVKAFCRQQFGYHIVLILDHSGTATTTATKFPTCCACAYVLKTDSV